VAPFKDWSLVVNFINILRAHFLYQSASHSFFNFNVTREKLPKRLPCEKGALKMLMKLTPGWGAKAGKLLFVKQSQVR